MAVGSNRVYGRKRVIGLVKELMTREGGGVLRSRHFPILVVEGFRGAGKTALLSELAAQLDQRVPYARLDLEANKQVSVPQVLSALAFELSRKCPRYGQIRFPRFIIGQLVMRLELDLTDRAKARRQVLDELKRQPVADVISEDALLVAASGVLNITGQYFGWTVKLPDSWLRPILKWLRERILRWRIDPGSFRNWYGHQDLGLPHDPSDVMADLNRWAANSEDEDNRRRIDELLWSAFLADLRAEFGRRRWADDRSLNCVILLDNADTDLAHRFLNQLARARRQRAVGEQDDADPLTVVATSRGPLLAHVSRTDLADVPGTDRAPVVPGNPRSGQLPQSTENWSLYSWLRYRLPDLTEDEVGRAVADMALGWGDNQRLTQIVYGLTGGHPASTRLVLDAMVRSSPQKWIAPEEILSPTRPDATSQPPTVEDEMLGRLLEDLATPTFPDLVTCAAARDRKQALALAGQDDLLVSGQVGYGKEIDPILWPAEESAGPTLLRRLLRRRLALRDSTVSPTWPNVYDRLRRICRNGHDEPGELYHALAEGELGFVTRRLHQRLTEGDSTTWCDLLASVTAAPRQHRGRASPIDEVRTLVGSADLDKTLISVGRLVAALWIASNPCTDSRRRHLHWQIAADYTDVSRHCPDGPHGVFLEAERRHHREAERWD